MALLLVMLVFPLLQLIPLPFDFWRSLPGHEWYAQALATTAGGETVRNAHATTLITSLTEYSWLALLPPIAVFLYAIGLSTEKLRTLVPVFLGLATFQAILGLVQYGDGPESIFRFGWYGSGVAAAGTYANRDHFAGLMEMALPVALAMLAATLGHTYSVRRHARNLRQKLAVLLATYFDRAAIYGAVSIALLLGLIFSHSRTGVMLSMVVIFMCLVAFSLRLGGKNVYGMIGSFTAVAIALAVEIGLVPVLDRFVGQDPLKDARWSIYSSTATAIGEFFPLGSGIGTFSQVYPRFHAPDLNGMFINSAHNDYLEWMMEGGIVSALLILGFFLLYLVQWRRVWKHGEWATFNFMQVGAGIGLFAMSLHTLVDFNLHIPANQIFLAFLAALFFHRATEEAQGKHRAHTSANEEEIVKPEEKLSQPEVRVYPTQSGPNPFAE